MCPHLGCACFFCYLTDTDKETSNRNTVLLEEALSVTWKWSHLLAFRKKSLYQTVFLFLYKLSNYRHLWVLFCKVVRNSKFTLGTASLLSQTHAAWHLLQSNAKLQGDSVGCLQPSHITLIDAAWLHRGLSTHSVCLAVESSWPSIDSSYTGCHLVDQFPLHSRKLNATPPLGSRRTRHVKIPYGWWGGWKSNHSSQCSE